MTALQSIVKEAKAIKKAYPKRFAKWTDYVRQASAIYASKHKGKLPVGKKKAVKKSAKKKAVGKVDTRLKKQLASQGKKMPHGYDVVKRKRKIGAVSKKATTTHKDTKSHNVNIRVMSGIGASSYALYNNVSEHINKCKKHIINAENHIERLKQYGTSPTAKKSIKMWKDYIKEQKTHIAQLKKHI